MSRAPESILYRQKVPWRTCWSCWRILGEWGERDSIWSPTDAESLLPPTAQGSRWYSCNCPRPWFLDSLSPISRENAISPQEPFWYSQALPCKKNIKRSSHFRTAQGNAMMWPEMRMRRLIGKQVQNAGILYFVICEREHWHGTSLFLQRSGQWWFLHVVWNKPQFNGSFLHMHAIINSLFFGSSRDLISSSRQDWQRALLICHLISRV